jgi:hypothetical protein
VTPFALTDVCTESSALSAGPCWLSATYATRLEANLSNDGVIETTPLDSFAATDEFTPPDGGSAPDDRSAFSRDMQIARLGR